MPSFVVKVTTREGWLRPPVVANCKDEDEAMSIVKSMSDEDDKVESKGIRPDVMKAAFGEIPEGAAVFRPDWIWRGDSPEPKS